MSAGNHTVLFVIVLGSCAFATLSSATSPHLNSSTCEVDYFTCNLPYSDYFCRCDKQLCTLFGDCCAESQYKHNTTGLEFACVSTSVLNEERSLKAAAYFMIASCPKSQSVRELTNGVANLCEAQSLSSPPISDNRTGLVYRNKYCAQCHGVPDREQISWPSEWRCDNSILDMFIEGNKTVDAGLLLSYCKVLLFVQPVKVHLSLPLLPRRCDARVTYTCQPPPGTDTSTAEYRALTELCRDELVNVRITESSSTTLYKNEFCALCSTFGQDLKILCPLEPDILPGGGDAPVPNTFTILLDVTGSGKVVIASEDIVVTSAVEQSCGEGQVFDIYSNVCREALCLPGYTYNGTTCLLLSQNCTLIALNATEYETINIQTIFWIAIQQNVSVQGYTSEGNPLVCTGFTSDFNTTVNETITRPLYGYPPAFAILSYLGLSVDVVAATILLFTYAAFAEMQTFYGKLFINFVLVLLLGDLAFLLGSAVYAVSLEDVVCQVVAILLHYLFLARFVWMSLLSLNVARHFYHAMKFIVNEERESWHYLILYMAAGWLSPLLVLIVTVPVNYSIPRSVGYGEEGLCWMDETLPIILSFTVPLTICILFTTGAFGFICIILLKLSRSKESKDLRHRTASRNCRVLIAVFCITGATWVFGFLATIDSALSWAWYLFIILNTTQAVFLALAYVCTAKVLRLYHTALAKWFQCGRKCQKTPHVPGHQLQDQLEMKLRVITNATVSTTVANTTGYINAL